MDATDLALRLLGKPVSSDRIAKVTKHLRSRAHYEAFLRELPEDVRGTVDAQLKAQVTAKHG